MTLIELGDDEIHSLTQFLDIVSVSRLERVARRMHDLKLVNDLKLDRAKFVTSLSCASPMSSATLRLKRTTMTVGVSSRTQVHPMCYPPC